MRACVGASTEAVSRAGTSRDASDASDAGDAGDAGDAPEANEAVRPGSRRQVACAQAPQGFDDIEPALLQRRERVFERAKRLARQRGVDARALAAFDHDPHVLQARAGSSDVLIQALEVPLLTFTIEHAARLPPFFDSRKHRAHDGAQV